MKHFHGSSFILGTAAIVFLAAPAWAQTSDITSVEVKPGNGGVNVVLRSSNGSQPQVFTTKRGASVVVDIINAKLRLPQGNSINQNQIGNGIASVTVNQLDANSVRVVVNGDGNTPESLPVVRGSNGLTLSFTKGSGIAAAPAAPAVPSGTAPGAPAPPQVTMDRTPAPPAAVGQSQNQAPPFLPRAVAPPVGDIAISNIDASPTTIDLGSQERVPRLVLRDAPVREVLSLLARAAGLNLAYTSTGGAAGASGQTAGGSEGPTISLDIQNEPVQDVFNYVLRLSGLEANRSGRTVFVGPKLPNSTRDVVMRNLRLNQVNVGVALNFLVGLGAETAVTRERQVTNVNAVPVTQGAAPITQTQTTTESRVETQRIDFQDSNPLLRGLQALGDERTNSLTLIGPPRLVEVAMSQLAQLDLRRRQVAVNVKILDVNLSGVKNMNTSFSFGVGNSFFVSDGGTAAFNFGGVNPPSSSQATNSLTTPTVIANPYSGANTFLDLSNTTPIPGTGIDTRRIINNQITGEFSAEEIAGQTPNFFNRRAGVSGNPFDAGITDFTRGTPQTITTTTTAGADGQPQTQTNLQQGAFGTATAALPSLFQYPKRFLLSLQAQVQNRNAKILTDPTLIVQEGQTANVNLTEQVVGNFKREITRGDGASTETVTVEKENVGLTLGVKVDRIDDNGFVSLSVAPTIKSPQASENITLGTSGGQRIFLVSERSVNSGLIRLRDGQTLILSGIIQDTDRTTISKLPILGDLPLIGSLFRRTNRENERREVIVLLTPQIMDDSDRSGYGYNYNPSPEVRQMLERRGVSTPRR
ncbi:MAG: AMIN domain-containing protein [Scytonematopsis contorta HA4267-MV1]|nr:AMIN domain-containing protein [Scytonematopsis contorta HA4267-MV1]